MFQVEESSFGGFIYMGFKRKGGHQGCGCEGTEGIIVYYRVLSFLNTYYRVLSFLNMYYRVLSFLNTYYRVLSCIIVYYHF